MSNILGPRKAPKPWGNAERGLTHQGGYEIKATYPYLNEAGEVVFERVRFEHPNPPPNGNRKLILPRHNNGLELVIGQPFGAMPPYGLSQMLEHADEEVWVLEGEKDADRANAASLVAISVIDGHVHCAKAAELLMGRTVNIIPDNDATGESRAQRLIDALAAKGIEVRIIRLPKAGRTGSIKDLSDYFDAGYTVSDLIKLTEAAVVEKANDDLAGVFTMLSDIDLDLEEQYLIQDILPRQGIGLLYAPTFQGKTFIGIDMAASIARGIPFAGQFEVEQGAVIYCAIENPASVKKRLFAYKHHHGINGAMLAVMKFRLNFGDQNSVDTFIDYLKRFTIQHGVKIALVVIDTMSKAMPGLEENSAKDMSRVVAELERIQEATGGCVLGVHHTGKNKESGARGSSALEAGADFTLRINAGSGGARTLEVMKQKDGNSFTVATFYLDDVELGESSKGRLISSAVVRYDDIKPTQPNQRKPLSPAERNIIEKINRMILEGQGRAEHGNPRIPDGTMVLEQSKLIEYCHERSKDSPTAELTKARRDTHGKQIDRMADKGYVGKACGLVWKIKV